MGVCHSTNKKTRYSPESKQSDLHIDRNTARKSTDGSLGMFAMKFPIIRRAFMIMKYHFIQNKDVQEFEGSMTMEEYKLTLPKLGINHTK